MTSYATNYFPPMGLGSGMHVRRKNFWLFSGVFNEITIPEMYVKVKIKPSLETKTVEFIIYDHDLGTGLKILNFKPSPLCRAIQEHFQPEIPKGQFILKLLDGCKWPLETWEFNNANFTNLKFLDSYEDSYVSSETEINLILTAEEIKYISFVPQKPAAYFIN